MVRGVIHALAVCLFAAGPARAETIAQALDGITHSLDARVGFYMHDLETGAVVTRAADQRFPLNSTFKLLACAVLLQRVDAGQSRIETVVPVAGHDLVSYSSAVQAHLLAGHCSLSLEHACGMVLSVGDNAAANIVLAEIGGPAGLTAHLRAIGDTQTRLDRWEPAMNTAQPGDPRDTTTPRAIAQSVTHLLLGDALSASSRSILAGWLAEHSVADALFRAALPDGWGIEDRTGAGGFGSRSIVAVIYPPNRRPVVAALYVTETTANTAMRNAAIARVGRAIVAKVSETQDQ